MTPTTTPITIYSTVSIMAEGRRPLNEHTGITVVLPFGEVEVRSPSGGPLLPGGPGSGVCRRTNSPGKCIAIRKQERFQD